jgi:hypothetical protein
MSAREGISEKIRYPLVFLGSENKGPSPWDSLDKETILY